MEYLADPSDVKEESDCETLEIDPEVLLRKGHLSWLFHLIYSISMNPADQSVDFCISCSRYLTPNEQPASHSYHHPPAQGPHHVYQLIRVQCRDNGLGDSDYYVSVQALREIQVPIGDVLSHMLPHPHPWVIRASGARNDLVRCVYLHPRNSKEEMWQGIMLSGRCAYRDCEKIFNNRLSHSKLYGITPQFCSINCKIKSWLCCNTSCNS